MTEINWWWLSYAHEDNGALGVIIMLAKDAPDATMLARKMELAPDGQVLVMPVVWGAEKIITLSETFRLLTPEYAKNLADRLDFYLKNPLVEVALVRSH